MDLVDWFAIAGVCFAGAATPGASLAVVVKNTSQGGRREGVKCALAHGVGVGIYAMFAVAGFSALIETMPKVVSSIELAGAIFLLWMGASALWSSNKVGGEAVEKAPGRGAIEGFLFAFMNPKIILFFLAILSTMLPAQTTSVNAQWSLRPQMSILLRLTTVTKSRLKKEMRALIWVQPKSSWIANQCVDPVVVSRRCHN